MNNTTFGNKGEKIAINFLQEKGYKIRETNWRFGHKEIDIIAEYRNELIIIEVKTRSTIFFETPEKAVTIKKQKFIIETTQKYIEKSNTNLDVRFDIIAITKVKNNFKVKHIKDAFTPHF